MIEFKGSHFERDVILWVELTKVPPATQVECRRRRSRWYVAYPISYRQLEEMMEEQGVEVDQPCSIAGCASTSHCWRGNFGHASNRETVHNVGMLWDRPVVVAGSSG